MDEEGGGVKLDPPVNKNYAAQVVRVPATVSLNGLDNLVGVPILGHQALTQKNGVVVGDLKVALTAETQVSHEYAAANDLYRDSTLNSDPTAKGYLEANRRIRALKLKGHRSDALLMPLESLAFTGVDPSQLREGDTFDTLTGIEICRKYEIPVKANPRGTTQSKVVKAFKRVDAKMLPEHVSTDNYFRSADAIPADAELIATAKYHGTSVRISNTIVRAKRTWRDRLAAKLGVRVLDHEYDYVHGSRKVIKDPGSTTSQHFYGFDLWTREGEKLRGILPQGVIVYGELVGWAEKGSAIQRGYDYGIPDGECELYVYRVSRISPDGFLSDLSWDQVVAFCQDRGLKHVPELWRGPHYLFDPDAWLDIRFRDAGYSECLPLAKKLVDEGVVIRVADGAAVPALYKIKSAKFLEHETKMLDADECDLESAA